MAVLLQIKNAHKSYGDQVLLDGAEATLIDDVKVGFVGRNGAGKSTLLRVLLGEEELDRGEIVRHPKLRLGYLRQHDPFLPGETALQFLIRDSGQPDWKCGEVAGQFELKKDYLEGPIAKLSGGWQTRVKLAALLLARAQSAAAGRTDQLSRSAHADPAGAFSPQFSGSLLDRLARSGVSRRHLHAHARLVARQADDVSRQDRRLSRVSAGDSRARRALERSHRRQAKATAGIHRQEQSPGQHRHAGPLQEQAARTPASQGHRQRRAHG